jgi:hypothetical protein
MKSLYLIFKSIFLQLILSIVSIISWMTCYDLGNEMYSEAGTYTKELADGSEVFVGTNIALSAGYTGGAIAMGIICSVCIIMIVWIEVNKSNSK